MALAMSLVLLQWGFYFDYHRDATVVINLFDADLWIIPKGQTTIDGFTTIDEQAYWKARDLPEIATAARNRADAPRRSATASTAAAQKIQAAWVWTSFAASA